jgi:predicted AAA+ superfamily ATPase
MATTNYERVGKALDLLRQGLTPFVERQMKAAYGGQWLKQVSYSLNRDSGRGTDSQSAIDNPQSAMADAHALLVVMWDHWNEAFKDTLGFTERSLVSELREWRNRWAHQQPFSGDDAYRALDSIVRLLTAISAPEAQEVERQKRELLRLRFEEQARQEGRKAAVAPIEGKPAGGLRPWREVVTPHPDVASGRYVQAEFAADLAAVYRAVPSSSPADTGTSEYSDPREFYRRTYLTEGLRHLLRTALLRLSGQGGDPVVELQTNFGGGKTHSMLALYHLFSNTPASELAGVEGLLKEMGMDSVPGSQSNIVHRAVLVGTALSPGQPHHAPDGTLIHTLWGEMAWQLGRAEGYGMVAQADRQGVSPGSNVLYDLFTRYGPCLVLIDEWVAFTRQLYKVEGLPAGSFDANLSFTQALTEAAKRAPTAMVVAALPTSDIEIGGEGGREALSRLKNTFGRVEASWRPASAEESFEIVRRRLFQPITDPTCYAARDAVVAAFANLYREQSAEFPSDCKEAPYERRMQAAYPIHPELFDRLYSDWSSLEKFQRTRGVLRLMAAVIHALWVRNDSSLLILPAGIPIDDSPVQFELTRYLEDHWVPVIEKDVDGPASLPLRLDRENPNLGRYSACRRVARTIYMGSAPTTRDKNPGLDERNVKLGCTQPGESVATFGDALRRLTDHATHLYVDRSRYWYSLQPSVTRLAQDRAAQYERHPDIVWEELKSRLRADRLRGDFSGVHIAPESSADVPDEQAVRLVVLGPRYPHAARDAGSPARQECTAMLRERGSAPRLYPNMLAFLAPDRNRLAELEDAIRQHLAWKSIYDERDTLNLDAFQRNQAETKFGQADETVKARIGETYAWLLVPGQPDPRVADLEWDESRLSGPDPLAVRASRKLKNDGQLMTQFSALNLKLEMDKYHLWGEGDHVGLKQLWEYFARYPYLSRLLNADVLIAAVQGGFGQTTWTENFAYAEGWDSETGRYLNLKAGQLGSVIMDARSVVVKPEAALRQLKREAQETSVLTTGTEVGGEGAGPTTGGNTGVIVPPVERKPRRFYGTVELDATRVGRDAGQVGEAVIQHLAGQMGARVKVTLEIDAELPEGAPDNVVRTVSENARTLKFKSAGFEER